MLMSLRLDGRRAVVTGGSSGIGEAICIALAAAGARVVVNCSRHIEKAKDVVQRIQSAGGDAMAIQADISKPAAAARMFHKVDAAWGGVDILINNAGIDGARALAWKADIDAWRQVIEINLFGAFYCAREALQRMVPQRKGVILSMSSVHEEIAWSGYSAYTASKAALGMMTKTLAQEAAPFGIRVLAVAPGAIQTPINASVWKNPKKRKDLLAKIPLGRMGIPGDVASMSTFLVSDAASYVTARTIFVDGGMTDYPDFAHGG
jgi:NAD(P)-dependent dehydrogenase (short-subunit alcohol dehydrogenase family)